MCRREVTPHDVETFLHAQLERLEDPEAGARIAEELRDAYESVPIPEQKPAFSDLQVDDEGNLWVAEYQPPGRPRDAWHVFDPDGRLVASVGVPERFRIQQVGDGFVLAITEDEIGIERVELFDLLQ